MRVVLPLFKRMNEDNYGPQGYYVGDGINGDWVM